MLVKNLLLAAVLICFCSSNVHADTILSNTFDDNVPGNTDPFSTGQIADANVSSVGVSRPGYTLNGGFNNLVAGELRRFAGNPFIGTRYFSFDITPINGAEIDFDDFTYNGAVQLNGATVGPDIFELRSSIDNFSTSLGGTETGTSVDLSGVAFQDVTSPVEFRLYVQSDGNAAGVSQNTTYSLNDFAFNGTVTVAVPEPSSIALFAISGLAIAARRRRQEIA